MINPLATASIYDPDPTQFLGIRLPVTFDTCEIIEERWANWLNEHGISANTRFEVCIAKDYPETGFDRAAFFDCLFTTWATWATRRRVDGRRADGRRPPRRQFEPGGRL